MRYISGRTSKNEDGFTLVELLIVVLIIGILAAIAIPVYLGLQNQAKNNTAKQDTNSTVHRIQVALTEGQEISGVLTANSDATGTYRADGTNITSTITSDNKNYTVVGTQKDTQFTYTYDSTTGKFTEGTADVVLGGSSSLATPAASFTATISGLTVTLDPSATTSAGGTNPYLWSTGDGNTARPTTTTYTYTYTTPGTYTITLTARNTPAGPTNSTTRTVTVTNAVTVANYDFETGTQGWAASDTFAPISTATNIGGHANVLKVSGTLPNNRHYTYVSSPTNTLITGTSYTLTAEIYVAAPTSGTTALVYADGSGAAPGSSTTIAGSWQTISKTFTPTIANRKFYLEVDDTEGSAAHTMTYYVDNVTLVRN